MDSFMVVIKSGPGERRGVRVGLRLVAAMLGMDQLPRLIFADGGVDCLRQGAIREEEFEYLKAAADLAGVYVLSESLARRGLAAGDLDPQLAITPVDLAGIAEMAAESGLVVAF